MLKDQLEALLPLVQKPARYTGGELNSVVKNPAQIKARVAFCFADVYEVGMSHLGLRILYDCLNKMDKVWCERVCAPWCDMEALLRERGLPLTTLESKTPLHEMDFVAFTLQYEMSYTNILNMLDLGGVPVLACERTDDDPLVLAGGPCANHPEPLADFVDIFSIGEGEEALPELMEAYMAHRAAGGSRRSFLEAAARLKGFYVPSLYRPEYGEDGSFKGTFPIHSWVPEKIEKRLVADFETASWPEKPIVPFLDLVHDRITLEIFRGCSRGCRFCQAGMIYRPVRERSVETLVRQAMDNMAASGYDEISLSSLSTGDYSQLTELIHQLVARTKQCHTTISLPSLRIDAYAKDYMTDLENERKAGLTLAPEAGTQRLRDVINKNVTEQNLMESVGDAFSSGWDRVKLYFMTGLPTETEADVLGIADLARKVTEVYRATPRDQRSKKRLTVTVSTSVFVPKPFTPFQWCPQDMLDRVEEKQALLRKALKGIPGVTYNWHDGKLSRLEAVIARGDRRVGRVIYRAWQLGARFDGWSDQFKYDVWMQAFRDTGVNPDDYAARARRKDEPFPWDHIDVGVNRAFLWHEYEKALKEQTTPDCRQGCQGCGMNRLARQKGVSPCVS